MPPKSLSGPGQAALHDVCGIYSGKIADLCIVDIQSCASGVGGCDCDVWTLHCRMRRSEDDRGGTAPQRPTAEAGACKLQASSSAAYTRDAHVQRSITGQATAQTLPESTPIATPGGLSSPRLRRSVPTSVPSSEITLRIRPRSMLPGPPWAPSLAFWDRYKYRITLPERSAAGPYSKYYA